MITVSCSASGTKTQVNIFSEPKIGFLDLFRNQQMRKLDRDGQPSLEEKFEPDMLALL
jgi:hypothetical protein